MALLKSYTCSKCAGVLIFDSDQSYFDCPFCGTKFNVVDFHGDELLAQAAACLAQNDFIAAKDKYNSVLENEPDNFEALRGLVLSEAGLPSPEWLCNPTNFKKNNISSINKFIEKAKARTKGAEASYFRKLSELVGLVNDIKTVENERYVVKADANKGKFKSASSSLERARTSRKVTTIAFAFVIFLSLIGGFVRLMQADAASFLSALILSFFEISLYVGYLVIFNIKAGKAEKPLRETVRIGATENMIAHNKIDAITAKYAAEYSNLLAIQAECGKAKTKSETAEEAAPAKAQDDVVADPSKTVLCAKCGASLALNNEKRVYECNSCGVAYGISLFFGLPLEKALNAMNNGNYSDAEQRFTNILMADPANFEALLGRILCQGRWTNISGIKSADELSPAVIKRIQMLVKESGEKALEEDRSYFEELDNLLTALVDCASADHKVEITKKQIGDYEAKERVYASVRSSDQSLERKELMLLNRSLKEYTEKQSSCNRHFTGLKNKLICMRNDSMLTK